MDALTPSRVQMKKRGHKPDSHTFTIMLRGYRNNVKKPNIVQRAVSVYDSIFAANSAVTPTTIHTNAILSVCARAHDTDSLWNIAGRLPERGPGAPDHVTFTTILQGLNSEAQKRAMEMGAREGPTFDPQPIFDGLIEDARKVWIDVTARWRKGELFIDEELVCAMGRLLMLSDKATTQRDVLNLVHQTMNLPKMPGLPDVDSQDPALDMAEADTLRPSTVDVPARLTPTQLKEASSSVHTVPGNNTLSMLVETATALRELRLGKYYWDLLTSETGPYQIVPDHQNITAYLRLLRVSRASSTVLDVLRQPRAEEVDFKLKTRGTFVIAMSTCLRDKRNPNVFETASRIMDMMQASTEDFDNSSEELGGQRLRFSPKVLRMYLEVAIATTKGINGVPLEKTKNGDLDFERDPSKNHTMVALKRLGPTTINARSLLKAYLVEVQQQAAIKQRTIRVKKLLDKRRITPLSVSENIAELHEMLRSMIGAYDKLILVNEKLEDEGMGPLPKDIVDECWHQKRKLSAYVSKYVNAEVEPKTLSRNKDMKLDERGHPVRRDRNSARNSQDDHFAAEDGVSDDELDPSVAAINPRAQALSSLKEAQDKAAKKSEERGLSRRQKLELHKVEQIRAQFPASMLREAEKSPRTMKKEEYRTKMGERLASARGENDSAKDWGDMQYGERKKAAKVFAKQKGIAPWHAEERIKRAVRERAEANKKPPKDAAHKISESEYSGWGGGFQDLVAQVGREERGKGKRGGSGNGGVVHLGP